MSYTEVMYEDEKYMDHLSCSVKSLAMEQGHQDCQQHYNLHQQHEDFACIHAKGDLRAQIFLHQHPEYLDEDKKYFEWFAYWYCVGYTRCESQSRSELLKSSELFFR